MTPAEAKETLGGKLVFGDDAQIEAVRFLENAAECKEAILGCENVEEHLNCEWIDAYCDCNYKFAYEIVEGALSELKFEKRKATR
jgi:hypothetical protein